MIVQDKLQSKESLWSEEYINGLNSDTTRAKLFIIGYPCEVGARNYEGRAGLDRGPDSFREIIDLTKLPSDPATFSSYLEKPLTDSVRLIDCGNIHVDQGKASELRDSVMFVAQEELRKFVAQILSKVENSFVFVIGGSDDLTLALLKAVDDGATTGEGSAILVDPSIDVKEKHRSRVSR